MFIETAESFLSRQLTIEPCLLFNLNVLKLAISSKLSMTTGDRRTSLKIVTQLFPNHAQSLHLPKKIDIPVLKVVFFLISELYSEDKLLIVNYRISELY